MAHVDKRFRVEEKPIISISLFVGMICWVTRQVYKLDYGQLFVSARA